MKGNNFLLIFLLVISVHVQRVRTLEGLAGVSNEREEKGGIAKFAKEHLRFADLPLRFYTNRGSQERASLCGICDLPGVSFVLKTPAVLLCEGGIKQIFLLVILAKLTALFYINENLQP